MNLIPYSRATIDGEFEGFNEDKLFKLHDGSFWVQAVYAYWYHYAYRPTVIIYRDSFGRFYLGLEGHSNVIQVSPVSGVVESQIEGEFKGWDGNSVYRLTNGQVWKQSQYKYEYTYEYRPEVIIYNDQMHVAGTSAYVRRAR